MGMLFRCRGRFRGGFDLLGPSFALVSFGTACGTEVPIATMRRRVNLLR